MENRVLVLGSSGNVGKPLVESLLAAQESVVAATRRPATHPDNPNLTSVRFDYADPSTFGPALEGVDRVFLLAPPGMLAADEISAPFLDAAFQTPRKFVLLSADGVQFNESAPLRKLERKLESSGHRYVFLRPNWFMDNFHTFWLEPIRSMGLIPLPAADSRSALIHALDIADSAFAVMRTGQFDNQAFSLSGPEAFTYAEAATVLSRAAGRQIEYRNVGDAEFLGSLLAAGLPDDYARYLVLLFSFVRQGFSGQVNDGVRQLTGHEPRTLASYAASYAPAWA